MKKDWHIFAIWAAVSALLVFGLLAMEQSGCDTRTSRSAGSGDGASVDSDDDSADGIGAGGRKKDRDRKSQDDPGSEDGGSSDDSARANGLPTVESIAAAVSALRGLPLNAAIEVSYIDREELQERIEEDFAEEYPPGELEAQGQALAALDLIPPGTDLREELEELMVDQIAGFYDDETKELALVSDSDELDVMNEVTLAHEVTHALQDQSFSLAGLYPVEGPGMADVNMARLALVEGDASLAMTEYVEAELSLMDMFNLGMSGGGSLLGTSPYLDDSLLFPYLAGEEFVAQVKEKGGWELVNAVYASPPESTEQIIHPEKYFEKDHPVFLALPDLLPVAGAGWEAVYDDSFGEFDVRQLLAEGLRYRQASEAAAGWDGGRYSYYERSDGAPMAVILLAWDSNEEAAEFTQAMAEYLAYSYCSEFEFAERQFPILESCDGDYWVMVKKGAAVLVARVPDRTLANLLPPAVLGVRPPEPGFADNIQPGNVLAAHQGG
ncbi:MAG: hypothetical protein C4534_10560 [Gaiellales bacterium]|nr:MAG: hypothetical protein C4534_10560 [Gaiellales bacterium]